MLRSLRARVHPHAPTGARTTGASAFMIARYAASFIDSLFVQEDLLTLHQVVSVVERTRSLPEEYWLFCRVYEWACARSGIWQYYEGLSEATFSRVALGLERFGLHEIAEKYRSARTEWRDQAKMARLDAYLEANSRNIHAAVFALIQPHKNLLKHES